MILNSAIMVFLLLELSNVVIMYFYPDSKYGNSISVFREWTTSKNDKTKHLVLKYLVNWVANCKLIFILLLLVVLLLGNDILKIFGIIVTIVAIGMYFVTLHPIISKLDQLGEITPKGYSKVLSKMILSFMVMFTVALFLHVAFNMR